MKIKTSNLKHGLLLVIFLFLIAGSLQKAQAQWWKDTLWTRSTDQKDGFYMLKFSKNDSIIVGHGMQMDLFFDAKTGNEIKRIPGNNEVFFINNDKNFVRTNDEQTQIEIFDSKTYQVIDKFENDGKKIGKIDVSNNERFIIGVVSGGLRIWDVQSKKILNTKMFPDEENLTSIGIGHLKINCTNDRMIGQFSKSYYNPSNPKNPINIGYFGVYDTNTLDSVDVFKNGQYFTLSNTCKYIAYKIGDIYNGVEVYDFNTKELLWTIPINGPSLTGLEFSPDDKFLVTANNNSDFGMKIWNCQTHQMVYDYISEATYSNISLSKNGKFILYSIGRNIGIYKTHFEDTSTQEQNETKLIIFPNPTNNTINLTFEVNSPINLNYSLYSDTGQLIKPLLNEFTKQGTVFKTFDISFLLSGNYYIRITGADFGLTFKVIIVK